MTLDEIKYELEVSGVAMEHVSKLVRVTKRYGYEPKKLDQTLMLWGYPKIFTIYDEEEETKS